MWRRVLSSGRILGWGAERAETDPAKSTDGSRRRATRRGLPLHTMPHHSLVRSRVSGKRIVNISSASGVSRDDPCYSSSHSSSLECRANNKESHSGCHRIASFLSNCAKRQAFPQVATFPANAALPRLRAALDRIGVPLAGYAPPPAAGINCVCMCRRALQKF